MTPFKAMFEVDAFEAWSELDIDNEGEEPTSLAVRLSMLHELLTGEGLRARTQAAVQYDKAVRQVQYEVGDRVVLWSTELAKR